MACLDRQSTVHVAVNELIDERIRDRWEREPIDDDDQNQSACIFNNEKNLFLISFFYFFQLMPTENSVRKHLKLCSMNETV